ncbi:aminotransferase class V-fold PLP-dependent enzyme [Leptolyngbya sp. AN02str]|uniref:aminotransferase class V-fold PLP-dependent enzyme n=1 Tax=Leptolyngbya sp. AN02str TaxID=3423363 RepID=UPI003D31E9F7
MTSTAGHLTELTQYRQQFPALANKAYFNFGGQGPMPESAIASILQAHTTSQQQGPFSNQVNQWIYHEMQQTREAIAQLLQVSADTITLTENVSSGCNIPLWGVDWREGDHLLLTDCEHPSVIGTAEEIRYRFGVKVTTCPMLETLNGGDPVAVIAQHLRPTTRMVVVSHVLWNTGQVLPLRAIADVCHTADNTYTPVRVLVDAAQSVGVLPLNLDELGVDFYAFTGHKWLCGPAGIGGLYVRPDALESIRPTFIGWRGLTKDSTGNPIGYQSDGRRFEVATSDFTLCGALREAIALHEQWGTATQRYRHICQLSKKLWEKLQAIPQVSCLRTAPPESGLVSFRIANANHNRIVQALEQKNIYVRTILHPDCIRACVHYFTQESELDHLVNAVHRLVENEV